MRPLALVALLFAGLGSGPAFAQDSNFALAALPSTAPPPGWTLTPALVLQEAWDDNALLLGNGDQGPADFLTLVNPRGDVSYLGRHGDFSASYDGAFVLYRQLNQLNSYDQHAMVQAHRQLSRHISVWASNGFASLPTTELLNFVAVPFIRAGSKLNELKAGVDAQLARHTSISGSYSFDWMRFDPNQPYALVLLGGHSHGASLALKHQLSENTSIIADYNLQHAIIDNGPDIVPSGGTFDVQNADAGLERRISEQMRIFGAFGFSRLGVTDFGPPRTGPAWRAGLVDIYKRFTFDASYARSYVPAFGFGGTYQNEELTGHVQATLTRRVYIQSLVSWRRNEPLEPNELRLKTFWVEGSLGYAVQTWARIELFYSGDRQNIDRPGGLASRNRFGIQVVTSKPLRVK